MLLLRVEALAILSICISHYDYFVSTYRVLLFTVERMEEKDPLQHYYKFYPSLLCL